MTRRSFIKLLSSTLLVAAIPLAIKAVPTAINSVKAISYTVPVTGLYHVQCRAMFATGTVGFTNNVRLYENETYTLHAYSDSSRWGKTALCVKDNKGAFHTLFPEQPDTSVGKMVANIQRISA